MMIRTKSTSFSVRPHMMDYQRKKGGTVVPPSDCKSETTKSPENQLITDGCPHGRGRTQAHTRICIDIIKTKI